MPCRMQPSALLTAFLYYFPPSSMLIDRLSPSMQNQLGLWEQVCVAPKLPSSPSPPPSPQQVEANTSYPADDEPAIPAVFDVQDYVDNLDGAQKPLLRIAVDESPEDSLNADEKPVQAPSSTSWVYVTRTVHSTIYRTYTPVP